MNSYKSRNHPWLLISVFLLCYYNTNAQGGTWVWMNGPDTLNGKGNYGTRGVAAASNCPPAFYQAAQWKDKQGNLWIYGGQGANPYRLPGDLWKFDPIVNMWTWVNGSGIGTASATFAALGIPSPANNPGGRQLGYPSWTDTSGDLWLFAGNGLCDLWRYNIASNEWTCMAYTYSPGIFGNLYQLSDSAIPGYRREENAAWTDANNNLWLFGGQRSTGIANDLWRYNVALGQWAWMGGSQSLNDAGSYGTLGVESPANRPPAREGRTRWTDSCYLYLASGAGQGLFNDVWRFNLNNNYWTWIGGDSGNAPNGQYTAYCYTANGDMPAGRTEERTAQLNGCTPLLFMWGGNNHSGHLNDLWSFDLGSNKWKWISGTDTGTFYGNFGTKGVPLATNMPPGMMGGCFWGDNSGHLWLWGGEGQGGSYNAMWEFIPDPTCLSIDTSNLSYQLSRTSICNGDSALISFNTGYSLSVAPNSNVTWLDSLHALLKPDSTTVFTINGYTPCGNYRVQNFTLPVMGSSNLSYQLSRTSICNGDSALISFNGGYSLSIAPNNNVSWLDSLHALLKPDSTTVFTISGYTACGDYNSQNFTLPVTGSSNLSYQLSRTSICNGDSALISFNGGY
ncbi:MAG: Ig-like, group 2, partial [Bacteroidota bacterium]|nr:Ig-like, group 2 [Bacteroidota bacterium]